ncbi:MAG: ATP-dependent helicase [Balneolaceae bacterium]
MKKFVLRNDFEISDSADYSVQYKDLLNEAQLEAVFHTHGPALVIAGAGTGKTRTLVYRVSRLIESGVNPRQILLLTFTRKAANEMLNRASMVLDERCSRVEGGTFHFYCSKLLHTYYEQIDYPSNFTIIDVSDATDLIQHIRSQLNFHKTRERFPNKNTLYSIFSSFVNRQKPILEILEEEYPQFLHHLNDISTIYDKYLEYKMLNHVMDFDDLLVNTKKLLTDNKTVRQEVAAKNRFVMVDEYQDTNFLQAELTGLFSCFHNNVMAVGDDAQSIYSFRGADYKNILQFPDRFKGSKIIKLEKNYRSTQSILDLANIILDQASEKFDKKLYTDNEKGDLPGLVKAANLNDQSRFLTQMILNLREQGYSLNEIAVLFRNGRDSFDLEVALNSKNIPFVKFGGQKFTEAAHIKDVLAHVKVLINPLDTIAWNRILMLIEGIGPKTAAELFNWIRKSKNPYNLTDANILSDRYLEQLKALARLFTDLQGLKTQVDEVLLRIVECYRSFCKKRFDDFPKRIKDLETFIDISGKYPNLQKLLEEIALDPIESTAVDTDPSQKDEPPLVLSTIHSAKGLEWKIVFIIQCLDGIIPSGYAVESDEKMDEEIRLLYVACTRARDQLFFTYPVLYQSRYGDYFTNPSRFLEKFPDSLAEPWLLVEEESNQNLILPSDNENYV